MNTLKKQVYGRFFWCVWTFFVAIIIGNMFASAFFATAGMISLIWFLEVWLEPEKWKQKQ